MLSYTAIYGYRSYYVYKDQRSNVDFDVIEHSRFYYKVERIRRYIEGGVESQQ